MDEQVVAAAPASVFDLVVAERLVGEDNPARAGRGPVEHLDLEPACAALLDADRAEVVLLVGPVRAVPERRAA
jgi:hypothetical protein